MTWRRVHPKALVLAGGAVCLFTWFLGETRRQNEAAEDIKLLQGTWSVVNLQQVNHVLTKQEQEFYKAGGYKITIHGDRMIHSPDKSEARYRLDTTASPRVLELLKEGEVIARAIYDLKGDDLKYCQGRSPVSLQGHLSVALKGAAKSTGFSFFKWTEYGVASLGIGRTKPKPPTDFDINKAARGTFPTLFVLRRDPVKSAGK